MGARTVVGVAPPGSGYGSGSGYGAGDGAGSGAGYGYGDGYGSGSGSGSGSGYGDGDGYGAGYGSGYGYGDGDGSGSGYGAGDGDGYGSGAGAGAGAGYGYGDGYGYGAGSGAGDGYGYGDGSGYWAAVVLTAPLSSAAAEDRRRAALEQGAVLALWRSGDDGAPCNGGAGRSVRPGQIDEVSGPLEVCSARALHATFAPEKWRGGRCWIVALFGEVAEDDWNLGALKRQIIDEVPLRAA